MGRTINSKRKSLRSKIFKSKVQTNMFSSEDEKKRFNQYMESIKKSDISRFEPFKEPNQTPIGNIVDSAIKKIDYLLDVLRFGIRK